MIIEYFLTRYIMPLHSKVNRLTGRYSHMLQFQLVLHQNQYKQFKKKYILNLNSHIKDDESTTIVKEFLNKADTSQYFSTISDPTVSHDE